MKKTKKTLRVLTAVVGFTAFTMLATGCGSSGSGEKKDVVSTENTTEDSKKKNVEVSIDEQVLLDKDGIKITATEYTTDTILGDGIKLLVENNTDTTYTIGCDALIVNDYMITDLFSSEVTAGKKSNETMYLSSSELEAAGIDTVGKVEMYFHAFSSDDWSNYLFQNEYCEIQTSEYENMDTTPNDEGTELYNANGIRIVGKAVDENSFWGTAILLYIENTSGTNVGISVDEMSINGFMMEPYFSTTCYDGKKSIDAITVFSSDLEANGIESIEEAELKFHIYNADTYDTIADSDPVTFSAQ